MGKDAFERYAQQVIDADNLAGELFLQFLPPQTATALELAKEWQAVARPYLVDKFAGEAIVLQMAAFWSVVRAGLEQMAAKGQMSKKERQQVEDVLLPLWVRMVRDTRAKPLPRQPRPKVPKPFRDAFK